MATPAEEVAQNAQYLGSAPLGNAGGGVIAVDTKPLQDLAYYTMAYSKQKHDEQKKDTDEKIAKLADLSNISLNDLRGKDKEEATAAYNKLFQKANEYARKTPKNQQEKLQNELDWQKEYGSFKNIYGSGKQRAVSYYTQENKINSDVTDASEKEAQLKRLNEKFDKTDIGTPISSMEDFKVQKVDLPKPVSQTFDTVGVDGNRDIVSTVSLFNPTGNLPFADATILGIKNVYKKGTPEYDKLSDLEKQQADQQAGVESSGKLWADMAEPINSVLGLYRDAEGKFHEDQFLEDNASNLTVLNAYNSLKNLSNYSSTKKQEAEQGVYNDKGVSFKLPPNIKPTDFNAGIIDFSKGVKPNQLVLAGQFAQYQGDKVEKKVIETDNAIQQDDNARGWAELAFKKKQAAKEETKKAADSIQDPAILFGNHVKRVTDWFKKDPKAAALSVGFGKVDKETRTATGLQENQRIEYHKDGTWAIISDADYSLDKNGKITDEDTEKVTTYKKGQVIKTGTIEGIKKGYIDAVKIGQGTDGAQTEGFQRNAEEGFNKTFGSNDPNAIFNSFMSGSKQAAPVTETAAPATTQSSSSSTTQTTTQKRKGKDGKVYTSTDGITWTAPDGTSVTIKK